LRALFIRSGLSTTEAEDLAVSCVTDIALKAGQYHQVPGGSFAAWVFTIARHALASWWRKNRSTEELPDDLVAPEPGPEEAATVSAIVAAVREAVAKLPEADQRLLRLRDLESREPYAEIARQMSLQIETTRVRHLRALQKLRTLLEADPRIQPLLRPKQRSSGGSSK